MPATPPEEVTSAAKPALVQKMSAEVIGTFFVTLVATGVDVLYFSGSGHVDYVSRWLARGFITTAMIYAFSSISGAHINPAVSLGFAVRRAMPVGQMLVYWVAQFVGGFSAALICFAVWGPAIALGASHPGPQVTQFEAAIAEVVLTFLVMMVILMTAEEAAAIGKNAALAVGLTVAACGFFAGPISGASMNPARSIPPLLLGAAGDLAWIYAAGPIIGAILAALVAAFFFAQPNKGEREAAKGK
ncbi:MAG: aquaporin [Candidatus Cybelea sp.]